MSLLSAEISGNEILFSIFGPMRDARDMLPIFLNSDPVIHLVDIVRSFQQEYCVPDHNPFVLDKVLPQRDVIHSALYKGELHLVRIALEFLATPLSLDFTMNNPANQTFHAKAYPKVDFSGAECAIWKHGDNVIAIVPYEQFDNLFGLVKYIYALVISFGIRPSNNVFTFEFYGEITNITMKGFNELTCVNSFPSTFLTSVSFENCVNLTTVPDFLPPTVLSLRKCFANVTAKHVMGTETWNVSNVVDFEKTFKNSHISSCNWSDFSSAFTAKEMFCGSHLLEDFHAKMPLLGDSTNMFKNLLHKSVKTGVLTNGKHHEDQKKALANMIVYKTLSFFLCFYGCNHEENKILLQLKGIGNTVKYLEELTPVELYKLIAMQKSFH